MTYPTHKSARFAGALLLLVLLGQTTMAQQSSIPALSVFDRTPTAVASLMDSEPPLPPPTPQSIICLLYTSPSPRD